MPLTSVAAQDQITEFLENYISDWPRDPYGWRASYYRAGWSAVPVSRSLTRELLARDLLASAEFRALQLGTWLNKPDGQVIIAAVEAITPPPYREDIELLVEALTLAATAQRGQGIQRAVLTTVASAGISLMFAASRN